MIEDRRQLYEFDEFRVDVFKRQLTRGGEVVPLYSKAFDVLLVLVQNAGRDLSKDELMDTVWPGQALEESNLSVNISAVRRALGEKAAQPRYIVNIPGTGYRFVAQIRDRHSESVIESRTISQITIEQEIETIDEDTSNQPLPATVPQLLTTNRRETNRVYVVLAVVGVFVLLAGVVAFTVRRFGQLQTNNSSFQNIALRQLTNDGNAGPLQYRPTASCSFLSTWNKTT